MISRARVLTNAVMGQSTHNQKFIFLGEIKKLMADKQNACINNP